MTYTTLHLTDEEVGVRPTHLPRPVDTFKAYRVDTNVQLELYYGNELQGRFVMGPRSVEGLERVVRDMRRALEDAGWLNP